MIDITNLITDAQLNDTYNAGRGAVVAHVDPGSHYMALRAVGFAVIAAYVASRPPDDTPRLVKFIYNARLDHYLAVWSDGTILKTSDMKHWVKLPTPIPSPKDFK